MADEIIEELWKTKDAIAKQFGCDVRALVAHLRSKERDEGVTGIDLSSVKRAWEQKKQRMANHRMYDSEWVRMRPSG